MTNLYRLSETTGFINTITFINANQFGGNFLPITVHHLCYHPDSNDIRQQSSPFHGDHMVTVMWSHCWLQYHTLRNTVYPKKYAHGFVVLCFVVVMQSFIMNSHEVFIHIHQGCFAGTGAIVRLPQCQWSKPDGYGKISQCITTTKHSKAKTMCIFLGIYCMWSHCWQQCHTLRITVETLGAVSM